MNSVVIEVIKKSNCQLNDETLIIKCEKYIKSKVIYAGMIISKFYNDLSDYIQHITIDDSENKDIINFTNTDIKWHVYSLCTIGGQVDSFQNDNNDEMTTLSTNWMIPAKDFHGLWETLIYDKQIKQDLLRYVSTMMLFSDKGVDSNIVCSNRVVLLHGPPGTGKTSLCKALAQKLAIRLTDRYSHGQFIEVNSHSLFSKWFSESGKLVTKMFSTIYDLIEDPNMFVCVLIDEIESLVHARNQCLSGNDPSDAIRVVNAVLTQIDQIKKYPNVLILTTSNMTTAIDLAFVDRADIKQYVGLPSVYAIYQIYYSCIKELMRSDVIVPQHPILSVNSIKGSIEQIECEYSKELLRISQLSSGFNGRSLRKVPFISHALFAKSNILSISEFLKCMQLAVQHLITEKQHFV